MKVKRRRPSLPTWRFTMQVTVEGRGTFSGSSEFQAKDIGAAMDLGAEEDVVEQLRQQGVDVDAEGMPDSIRKLVLTVERV